MLKEFQGHSPAVHLYGAQATTTQIYTYNENLGNLGLAGAAQEGSARLTEARDKTRSGKPRGLKEPLAGPGSASEAPRELPREAPGGHGLQNLLKPIEF